MISTTVKTPYKHRYLQKSHQRNQVIDHNELTEKLNRLTSTSSPSLNQPTTNSMPAAKIGDTSTSSLPAATVSTPPMSKPVTTSKSLNNSVSSFYKISPEEFKKDVQRYNLLRTKKTELERKLFEKLRELKDVCIEEGGITGELPDEIHAAILPGDEFPRLKKRVGTAYSIPDELIKADKADKMGQLETDVECHRRIVAAASRLATDKHTNKSVRKKRQKDLLAARQKLSRLEQGLQQMRHSASKPDISSIASDGSSNSWNVSSHSAPMTMAMTKSCPTTPRGSIPDLRKHDYDDEKSEIEDHSIEERVSRRAPSALSRHSLQQRYSGISSSSTSSGSDSIGGGLPPRPKPSSVYTQTPAIDCLMMEMTSPLYENVGYRSTSYRSSYRQAHYPTIQDEHTQQQIQKDRKRAQSAHQIIGTDQNRTCTYSVPLNDAKQKFIDMDFDDNDVTPTADYPQSMGLNHRLTSSISCQGGFATASLDRRKSNVQRIPMNGSSDDMIRQNVTTRITTFPVAQPQNTVILAGGKPYSTSELPRFPHPPPVARVTHLPRGSLPPYSGSPSGGIPKTNPQMEALLSYYKQQTNQQQNSQNGQKRTAAASKTATIV